MATSEAILSRIDIPERAQKHIRDLCRSAVLKGSEAQLMSPKGDVSKLPEPVYNLLVQV